VVVVVGGVDACHYGCRAGQPVVKLISDAKDNNILLVAQLVWFYFG
jgi:hypothetical protein